MPIQQLVVAFIMRVIVTPSLKKEKAFKNESTFTIQPPQK